MCERTRLTQHQEGMERIERRTVSSSSRSGFRVFAAARGLFKVSLRNGECAANFGTTPSAARGSFSLARDQEANGKKKEKNTSWHVQRDGEQSPFQGNVDVF